MSGIMKTPRKRAKAVSGTTGQPRPLNIASILVPTDFSPPSFKALKYAAALARQFEAKITLLYVLEPVVMPDFAAFPLAMDEDKVIRNAEVELKALPAKQGIDGALVERAVVRSGSPHREITAAAFSLKVDLIVISTHGRKGLAHTLVGSTTERVVRHAPCPVLVVREREREFV
jgi:nucleotide-binding universal stress UspA family protein